MNLPLLFAVASAAIAAAFALATPFSKQLTLPKWTFALGMLALAAEQIFFAFALRADSSLEVASLIQLRFIATASLPGLWLLFAATYSRGNVKAAVKKRLPLILIAFCVPLGVVLLTPETLIIPDRAPTLAPQRWSVSIGWSGFLLHLFLLISMIGALVGLERTFRASVGTLRWKVKFMLYGLGTLFAARFFTSSQFLLLQEINPGLDTINAVALLMACLLISRSLMRRGSFEIDLYPSQSVISGSLTITLAGTYLIIVGVLSKVVALLGGEQGLAIQTFLILVALVGLGLLVQSDRFRQLIRRFVSRNFQRPLYDYRNLWLKVTEATSQSVRRKDICKTTTRLLTNLFDTKLTSIWLLDPSASIFVLAASSDQQTNLSLQSEGKTIDAKDIAAQLLKKHDPFDLENEDGEWAEPIRESNPSSFDDGGNRILVPLVGRGTTVGFIVLGDRTNTLKFTQQEFDTLRCIADHISASLLSAALTRKLEQSKEIEAFQTMATFFVHDLKNAVSTLNLMLKNMPNHWDNPEFREDALRGIGNTSQRITDLITRLGQVRHELQIRPATADLAQLVRKVVDQWQRPHHIQFSNSIDGEFLLRLDVEKVQSVLQNLLINATEAVEAKGSGSIELEITEGDRWIILSVKDDGPGMSEEFLRTSLFRPFKTTKKSGLGIGMFQSKMVMEAHGGSITAESQEGCGTTFSLRFPKPAALRSDGSGATG